jgi:hypothetical protein
MIIVFPFQVGLNFLIKLCLILRFKNSLKKNLKILKFFSLLQINIFYVFVLFKKNMLRLCMAAKLDPRNFKIFNFFLYFKIMFFMMFLYYFLNIFSKKYIEIVSG